MKTGEYFPIRVNVDASSVLHIVAPAAGVLRAVHVEEGAIAVPLSANEVTAINIAHLFLHRAFHRSFTPDMLSRAMRIIIFPLS